MTLQPIRRFGFDAAILFSDLLVPLEAMGLEVEFTDEGPRLPAPLRTPADLGRVSRFDPAARTGFVLETIKLARAELGDTPLIGFAGAPFTVATYAIEGKTAKTFSETKKFFYREPEAARRLLALIAEATRDYLLAQIRAGAQAVQLFDSWVGVLSAEDFETFALPPTAALVAELRATGVPVIYFGNGAASILDRVARVGADVYGVDWRVPIDEARARPGRRGGRAGQPRSVDAARARSPRSSGARATSSAAAASAGTSSTWDTASLPRRRSRRSRRWSPRCGAHEPGGRGRQRATAPGGRARADRPRGAEPGRARLARRRRAVPAPPVRRSRRHPAGLAELPAAAAGAHDRASGAARRRAPRTSRSAGARRSARRRPRRPTAVAAELARRGVAVKPVVAMAAWHPFADEALGALAAQGIDRAVALPLYPHESRTTTGSSLNQLEDAPRPPGRDRDRRDPALPRRRRLRARGRRALRGGVATLPAEHRATAPVLFSAHGLPEAYIKRGDPYLDDVRITVETVTRRLGLGARARLCFQSRVGPQRWLGPTTEAVLDELAAAETPAVVVVPIAFTGEHIETLQEIDILYKERAQQAGIVHFARARTVGCHPAFIAALADLVEATAHARGWA